MIDFSSLAVQVSTEELQKMIADADSNGSGEIDFPEFVEMMSGKMNEPGSRWAQAAKAAQDEIAARPVRNVGVQTKDKGLAKLSDIEVLEHELHSRGKQGDARENVRLRKLLNVNFADRRAEELAAGAMERVLCLALESTEEELSAAHEVYRDRIGDLEREVEYERSRIGGKKVDRAKEALRKAEALREAKLKQSAPVAEGMSFKKPSKQPDRRGNIVFGEGAMQPDAKPGETAANGAGERAAKSTGKTTTAPKAEAIGRKSVLAASGTAGPMHESPPSFQIATPSKAEKTAATKPTAARAKSKPKPKAAARPAPAPAEPPAVEAKVEARLEARMEAKVDAKVDGPAAATQPSASAAKREVRAEKERPAMPPKANRSASPPKRSAPPTAAPAAANKKKPSEAAQRVAAARAAASRRPQKPALETPAPATLETVEPPASGTVPAAGPPNQGGIPRTASIVERLPANLHGAYARLREGLAQRFSTVMHEFMQADADGSGMISLDEWVQRLPKMGIVGDEAISAATALFEVLDGDRSGTIEFKECASRR